MKKVDKRAVAASRNIELRKVLTAARQEPDEWFDVTEEASRYGNSTNMASIFSQLAGRMILQVTTQGGNVHILWRGDNDG